MEVLYGLFILYAVMMIYQAISASVVRRRRLERAKQVEAIAAVLGGEYEAESTPSRLGRSNMIHGLIQHHEVTMFDLVDGRKMVTQLKMRLAGRRSPTFRIRERTWMDKEGADMLMGKQYVVTSLYPIRLHDLFDQHALLALDSYQITASVGGGYVKLGFAAAGVAETKEQYADLIEAAEMILARLEAYHRPVVAAQPVRERQPLRTQSAVSTFWLGHNRRRRTPKHRVPAMCPEYLRSSIEVNTR